LGPASPVAIINLPVRWQKKAYNAPVDKEETRMPEEPDSDRDATGERATPDEWHDLTPAVRRVDDAGSVDTDSAGTPTDRWADLTPAVERVADSKTREGWEDLTPAVRPVEEGESDEWEWSTDEIQPPGLEEGPAGTGEPQLLPEDQHQADETDETGGDTSEDEHFATEAPGEKLGPSAPETDVEQPLAVHVEEMVKRLGIVIAVAGLVSVVVFPLTETLITIIWNQVLPGAEAVDPRVYHPLELVITQLKVASLAGLVAALPVFVYESYVFMRPGLYRNERRYYIAAIPTSLVLGVLGVLFAFYVVLPYTMDYFQGYTKGTADVAFALGSTFNLILMVMGYLAVVFQIPLFIMLAIMLGVTTREWLESRRLLFWGAFAGISFTFGAIDPTGVVPILVALTMIALFEATLALLRWTGN
jgi:sec-independent protein translocase protein TatC